jgi:uncharacterized RDD family membrane protein YckC
VGKTIPVTLDSTVVPPAARSSSAGVPPVTVPAAQPATAPAATPGADADSPAYGRFVTGEAVGLDLPLARLGSRMLARAVDLILQLIAFIVLIGGLLILVAALSTSGLITVDEPLLSGLTIVAITTVVVGYPVLMETLFGGRTVGKLLLGLRVVRDDGGPIRFRQALTRALVGAAVEWPGLVAPPLTWLVAIWAMTVDPYGRRLGDHAAGTLVVHEGAGRSRDAPLPPMPPLLTRWAAGLDLASVDDELALAVRHFLIRNRQLSEPARTWLGERLTLEVAAAIRRPPPPWARGWEFLAAVHAERSRRAWLRQRADGGTTPVR